MWVYKYEQNARVEESGTEEGLVVKNWIVGYYDPNGLWQATSYFIYEEDAAAQTSYLNGGGIPSHVIRDSGEADGEPAEITYTLAADQTAIVEGDSVCWTLITTGLPNGATVSWNLTGIDATDVVNSQTSGEFTILNNYGSYCTHLTADEVNEGVETMCMELLNGAVDPVCVEVRDQETQSGEGRV
jgi:hypothetical protein